MHLIILRNVTCFLFLRAITFRAACEVCDLNRVNQLINLCQPGDFGFDFLDELANSHNWYIMKCNPISEENFVAEVSKC